MIGRILHRYRILEQLGQGGFAVVYKARDEQLERDVAVKVLHPHLASKLEHRRRLLREAKAVARLHHPNIVEIFDFSGEESTDAYLVTELINGSTLRTYAHDHPFDPPELAAACVHVLAGALAHAHANGIVHRDLKPDNVMIREEGAVPTVKLMDFGIAQILDRDERMTITGSLVGSPAHMAPEIIDGEEADARSDLFSLGTILYWLATGVLPFEAPSPGALLKKILLGDYADPREVRPGVSDGLAKVIAGLLERDRSKRTATAEILQQQLAAVVEDAGLGPPHELLARFLARPEQTAIETRLSIVQHLLKVGEAAAKERKPARALSAFARVIALVPGTSEAGAARQAIDQLRARSRWRKRAIAALGLVIVGSTAMGVKAWVDSWPPPPPLPVADVVVDAGTTVAAVDPGDLDDRPITPQTPDAGPPERLPGRDGRVRPIRPARIGNGSVDLISRPAAAAVFVDGVRVGFTPMLGRVLGAGVHQIRLEHRCCAPLDVPVDVTAEATVVVRRNLPPREAQLDLAVDGPTDTQVRVDDRFVGYLWEIKGKTVPVALSFDEASNAIEYERKVTVALTRAGYADRVEAVDVRAGETRQVAVRMEPR